MTALAAREHNAAEELQQLRQEQFNLRVENQNLSRNITHARKEADAWVGSMITGQNANLLSHPTPYSNTHTHPHTHQRTRLDQTAEWSRLNVTDGV